MRILHVIPAVAARYGGPSVVALSTVRALTARGHEAMLATTDADGPGRLALPHGRSTTFGGVPVVGFRRTASESFKWSPGLASWLDAHVSHFDVVDIHAVFSHSSLAAGQACRRHGVPYVVRPHGALDPWSLGRKRFQKQALMMVGARALLSGAARMQYTTDEERRLAEQSGLALSPAAIVPLGIDDAYFMDRQRHVGTASVVLVMSRLEAKKGIELIIDAFHDATADASLAQWQLVIAGSGDPAYVSSLQERAARGAAARRIQFPGWIDGDAKRHHLREAALFASPSEQENFGISIVEAMASGVPVLISPGVNLAREVTRTGAGWVVDRRREEWTATLGAVLSNPSELSARGDAARGLAEAYRWPASIDRLLDLYERVRQARRAA